MKPIFEIVRRGSGANSVAIFPAAGPTENALYPKHKQIADAEDLKTYKYGMKGIKGQICRRTKINLERGRGASLILLWTKMHLCVTFVGGSIRLRRTAYMRTGFLAGLHLQLRWVQTNEGRNIVAGLQLPCRRKCKKKTAIMRGK